METKLASDFSLKTYLIKVLNIFRLLIYQHINLLITLSKQKTQTKTLLLIRLDSIGDYVLIRNYLYSIKKSNKYTDYNITLCGNQLWKDLSETFDRDLFLDFIWVNRKKFNNNPFYKYNILKRVYKKGFEVVIDTTFSREILFGDLIVKTSRAKQKIGSTGSPDSYVKWKRNLLTDKWYTKLIPQSSENIFEFYRNKEFFENILQEKIDWLKPSLACEIVKINLPTSKEFIVIFPGAQEEKRRWSVEKFVIAIQAIMKRLNLDVIIAGSKSEIGIAEKIIYSLNTQRVFDMTGKTTLPQLAKLISQSKVLISNETSAVHFAAAVGTPFVCISNGNHFGRFNPYPEEMNIKGTYIYPPQIENQINNFRMLTQKYQFDSDLDINSISADKVISAFSQLL
jgi:ADP-heptose:LPS heptosyltransferase